MKCRNHRKSKSRDKKLQRFDFEQQKEMLYRLNISDNLNVFLGAGVSASCGLPDWAGLLSRIRSRIEERNIEVSHDAVVANLARKVFGLQFNDVVADCLYQNGLNISETALAITKLGVKNIVCFNFDDILEEVYQSELIPHDVVLNGERFNQNWKRTTIFHPHGFLGRFESSAERCANAIILSDSDYENLYEDHYCLTNLLQLSMLLTRSNLFIGMSMTDPNIERLLKKARAVGVYHWHYALMKRGSEESVQAETIRLRKMGVDPVWCSDYSDIPQFLREISKSNRQSPNITL